MSPAGGFLPYLGILLAAIVEGEIAYVAACTLVATGHLDAGAVVAAGAAGAAIGDQAWFYVFRGRVSRWVSRFPSLERRTRPLASMVERHAAPMVLLIRFAPGLRVALALACAYIDMRPITFSVLNAVTAVVWAAGLLVLVAHAGPAALAQLGLGGWKAALLIAVAVVGLFKLLGVIERKALIADGSSSIG